MSTEAFDLARRDIEASLGEWFVEGAGFDLAPTFADALMEDDHFTTVVWTYSCRDDHGFSGAAPTHRELVIEGITIVEGGGSDAIFHRFVDWNGLMAQLGYTASMRPPIPAPEPTTT